MAAGHAKSGSYGPYRPRVQLGAIGEGWRLLQERWGTWVVASFIVLLANSVVSGAALSVLPDHGGPGIRLHGPTDVKLVTLLVNGIVTGFFYGGMFRMACLQVRGARFGVSDLFSVVDVFGELVISSALYVVICFLAGSLCVLPYFIAAGVLMFVGPLVVDAKLTGTQAISTSWHALKSQWLMAAIFHFVASVCSSLGGICCGIGIFFTMPIYCLAIAVLYRDFFLAKQAAAPDKSPIGDPDF